MFLHTRPLKSNDLVVEEGKTSRYISFVESCMFKYYSLKDGEKVTTYISTENTFLACLLSFVGEKPARENIRH